MPRSIRYHFRQRFSASARKAYEWCTDYCPGSVDHVLMGEKNGQRRVERLADSTIILTDTFRSEKCAVEKQKLVELYPHRLSWNATHISGPSKYSQFLYEIASEGENTSHLNFTGLYLDYKNLSKQEAATLAKELRTEDSKVWKLLAKTMAKELK